MIFLYNFEAAIFRSVGDTKVPLQALALSGVAIATVISNAVSALILFFRLLRTDKWIRLQPARLRISGECLGQNYGFFCPCLTVIPRSSNWATPDWC